MSDTNRCDASGKRTRQMYATTNCGFSRRRSALTSFEGEPYNRFMAGKKSKSATAEAEMSIPRVVGIVGSDSFLGRSLAERLSRDPSIERIVQVDLRPPEHLPPNSIFRRVDLTRPSADQELADVLLVEKVDTLVHLAYFGTPVPDASYAHELEAIGTLHMLSAVATAGVRRLVVQSTTAVYGAHRKNPQLLTERHPTRGAPTSRFITDKVEAETQVLRFAADRRRQVEVTVLRFAPVVGPTVRNLFQRYLTRSFAPTLAGFDPLIQTLHEEDAVDALEAAVKSGARGAFNVAPDGVLPLSTALRLSGAQPVPLPSPLAAATLQGLRASGLTPTPASMLNYLQYVFVADGSLFRKTVGFSPRFTTREAILALSPRSRRSA